MTTENLWMVGFEAVFPASHLTYDDHVVFTMHANKDTRWTAANATIRAYEFAGGNVSQALDKIDELLRSGNTNAALLVMNLVTSQLNSGSDVRVQWFSVILKFRFDRVVREITAGDRSR